MMVEKIGGVSFSSQGKGVVVNNPPEPKVDFRQMSRESLLSEVRRRHKMYSNLA